MNKINAIALATALLASANQANASTNLVVNGGFEAQSVQNTGQGFDTFNNVSQGLVGWTIRSNVDLVGTYWTAASGNNSLDLNGTGKGQISQVLNTVVGQLYSLSFDLAANTNAGTDLKGVSVSLITPNIYKADPTGHSNTNMGWTHYSGQFVAQSAQTLLSFTSTVNGPAGVALDNISVTAVPEPETYALMLAGLGLMATVARRRQQNKGA